MNTLTDFTTSESKPILPRISPPRRLGRIFALEALFELRKVFRMPAYLLPTLLFPAMFYLLFGVSFGESRAVGAVNMSTYLLATYGAFGVFGTSLMGFGVSCAIERGQGWTLLKQASPMPTSAYFFAKTVVGTLMSATVVALLIGLGLSFGKVAWEPAKLLFMTAVLLLGAIPFNAFGVLIGLGAGPNSAPAVANLIYLPMGFLSGLWIPIQVLPDMFQKIAVFLPAYHYAQLALAPLNADLGGNPVLHVAYLVVFTVVCLGLAAWLWRRDEGKTYG